MIQQPPIDLCFYNRYTGLVSKVPVENSYRAMVAVDALEAKRSGLVWLEQCGKKFFDRLCYSPKDLEAREEERRKFAIERGWTV